MSSAAETHFLQFAIQWASIALIYYDYILTFPQEVKYIWRGTKRNLLVLLYILCRYALLANVLYLLAIANKLGGRSSCDLGYKIIGVVSVLGRAAVIFTFLVRAYVVCARSKIILGVLGAIGLTCVVLDAIHVPGLRCKGSSSIQIASTLLAILVCVFETLVTVITLFRSFQALRYGGSSLLTKRHTFHYLVVEQGLLYFALISCFTIGAAALNLRASGEFFPRLLNAFTLPLSGLLTARFILRLRVYHERGIGTDSSNSPVSSFEVAANEQVSRTIFDEFGVDPVAFVTRKRDEERGDYASHGLRFAVNTESTTVGRSSDIGETATYVKSVGHGAISSHGGLSEPPHAGTYEFVEGSSGGSPVDVAGEDLGIIV